MQCVVITAYKNPLMLKSLLIVLQKQFKCFVHINKKVGIILVSFALNFLRCFSVPITL